jgi:ubiquinone/menaquinone biosynthesis C-methylase UbiE
MTVLMRLTRVLLALLGLAGLGFGISLAWPMLLAVPSAGVSFPGWVIVGPFLHDGLIAPLVGVFGLLVVRRLPATWRAPVTAGAAVSGVLLLLSVPHLWRAFAPNHYPGLDDRDYSAGLLVALAVVWALALAVGGIRALRSQVMRESTNADVRRFFDAIAAHYDRQIAFWERRLFPGSRAWAVGQARGRVVEIAVGTGLNLPLYAEEVTVIGVELSEGMLDIARRRVTEADLADRVELRLGDVQALDLPDASADTVLSTFTMCTIPDPAAAMREAYRVLRPGGRFVLAEHGPSSCPVLRSMMRVAERLTVRFAADHLTRDPTPLLTEAGFRVESVSRARLGISFRVLATRP